MDPGSSLVTKAVAAAAADVGKEGKGLLTRLFGPAADEVGELLRVRAEGYRLRRERQLERARAMLDEAGVEPALPPLKALLPILEHGALEEDAGLAERWAALLANAAAGNGADGYAGYAGILAALEPPEAAVLDAVADGSRGMGRKRLAELEDSGLPAPVAGVRLQYRVGRQAAEAVGLSVERFAVAVDNLIRLGLVRDVSVVRLGIEPASSSRLMTHKNGTPQRLVAHPNRTGPQSKTTPLPSNNRESLALTHLGRAFALACRSPADWRSSGDGDAD